MATTGPVAILAGAGTGKTRVISHRVAYAAASGAIDPRRALVVTFTDKAATEMQRRLRKLGLPQVAASTFHAAAKRQLEYFWPMVHGRPLPRVLSSKLALIGPLARGLPGGYKFTPARDIADEIEWAKSRRIGPEDYPVEATRAGRELPIPADILARLFARYEQAKRRDDVIDFEDMLGLAVDLYETDADAAAVVHTRYAWFSVDEYQDTNRLQEDLLRLWLGDRRDLCVVGDANQTIYSFTGASPEYLTRFAERYPDAQVLRLTQNYRSTPQILQLANRLIAGAEQSSPLRATRPDGPVPRVVAHPDDRAELDSIVSGIRAQLSDGLASNEIAILVRTNAQLLPIESALTAAGVPFTVRGQRFFARPEVRQARQAVRSAKAGGSLEQILLGRWRSSLGFDESQPSGPGAEARERDASLHTLLRIARELAAANPAASVADYLAELQRRDEAEAAAQGEGVVLSTYHRAKGLEWDAVYLPMLEDGTLPIRQSLKDDAAIEEERRLLYVGITRARSQLTLSWAAQRLNAKGGPGHARPSRFLAELGGASRVRSPRGSAPPEPPGPLFDALRAWRLERARADGVPAYVVADNKTLAAIATRAPRTEDQLFTVPGMGAQRVARYGDEILRVITEESSAAEDASTA
jgi:DNA helicase-2/ATP-dependent DNA helicase PcrA